jgi:hypothetical protein
MCARCDPPWGLVPSARGGEGVQVQECVDGVCLLLCWQVHCLQCCQPSVMQSPATGVLSRVYTIH